MPECNLALAQCVIYLAMDPKSNSVYTAYQQAASDANKMLAEPVPLQLRNAPTTLMKELGYGKGYEYAHDAPQKLTKMQCLPDSLKEKSYYHPNDSGREKLIKERLQAIKKHKKG